MPQPGSATTILIVDDEAPLSMLMGRFLDDRGWVALVAGSGGEALRIVESYPDEIDLLVTDVVMDEMDGFTLAAHVAALRPAVKIVYVTGHSTDAAGVGRGLREAGRFFLTKPFDRRAFLETVDAALARQVRATDEMAVILGNPLVEATPLAETDPSGAIRYGVDLQARYRWREMSVWRTGRAVALSRSQVDVVVPISPDPVPALPAAPVIELRLELPYPGARRAEVTASGRVAGPPTVDGPDRVRVTVDVLSYHADIRR